MKVFLKKLLLSALFSACALLSAQTVWAYDSAVKVGVGSYTLDYQDQAKSVKGSTGGLTIGYIGRFNPYLGFDVRWGGAGSTSGAGLTLKPGAHLSLFFRPSLPLGETADLYGLLGFTSLAIGRTPANGGEEVIARVGGSAGLGVDFHVSRHMLLGVEWVSYQSNVNYGPDSNYSNWTGVTSAKVSLSALTANFTYRF